MSRHLESSGAPTDDRTPVVEAAGNLDLPTAMGLASAHALIVQGKLEDAADLLSRLLASAPNPGALDLLARVYAQQNKWSEAQATWERLLQFDPDHVAARAALRRLSSPWKSAAVARRCAVLVACAVCVVLAGIGLLTVMGVLRMPKPTPLHGSQRETKPAPLISQAMPDRTGVHEATNLPGELVSPPIVPTRLGTDRPAATPLVSSAREDLDIAQMPIPRIEIPGCAVSTNARGIRVVFDQGLFRYRCEIAASGGALLSNVAKAMSECPPIERVLIEGHTDNEPMPPGGRYPDNYALGFARATTVAAWLHEHTAIPREALIATSSGAENPPFSNDTYESRLRNRTVVLQVRFAEGATDAAP